MFGWLIIEFVYITVLVCVAALAIIGAIMALYGPPKHSIERVFLL